jgi:hypothetical protein
MSFSLLAHVRLMAEGLISRIPLLQGNLQRKSPVRRLIPVDTRPKVIDIMDPQGKFRYGKEQRNKNQGTAEKNS